MTGTNPRGSNAGDRRKSFRVTARLSRKFYERFGDELVNELVEWFNMVDATYRGDLRELNELNFARFDAKLEQRLAQSDAKLEQRLAELKIELLTALAAQRTEFLTGLAAQRGDVIKWMFLFWVGNAATTAGLVFGLAHFLRP